MFIHAHASTCMSKIIYHNYISFFKKIAYIFFFKRCIYSHREKKLQQKSYFMFIWRELAVAYKKCGMPYTTGQTHSNTSQTTQNQS